MSLQQWLPAQDAPEVPVNENFEALAHMAVYAKDATTTTGLTWGYLGGRWGGFEVAAGTLNLTASSTCYIVVARSTGVISASSDDTHWNDAAAYARVYKLTVGESTVSAVEDHRAGAHGVFAGGSDSGGGGAAALAGLTDVDLAGLADGDVLVYDAATEKWVAGENGAAAGTSGTFMPVIVGATTAGVGTYNVQTGYYTKVGKMVTIFLSLNWTAHTGTGSLRIAGLPFSIASGAGALLQAQGSNMTWGGTLQARGFSGGGFLALQGSASGQTGPTDIPFDTSAGVTVSGTYCCA